MIQQFNGIVRLSSSSGAIAYLTENLIQIQVINGKGKFKDISKSILFKYLRPSEPNRSTNAASTPLI